MIEKVNNEKALSNLQVQTLDHDVVSLKDLYVDQKLLLLFYNNDCLGCTGRALPLAHQLQQEFEGVKVVGIHVDFNQSVSKEEIYNIFTIAEPPFPIYFDIDQELYRSFQCEGTPHWILLDEGLSIRQSVFGSQAGAEQRLIYTLEEIVSPG